MKPVVVLEELLRLLEEVKQGMPELEFRQYKRKVAHLLLEAGRRLLGAPAQEGPGQPCLGTIRPEPTQILTVFQDQRQTLPIHLGMDNGANVSYVTRKEVTKRGFAMKPNSQMSRLGDGKTLLPAIGEIDETFHRNSWTVRFRALVVDNLHADFVAGTPFMVDNHVTQDFVKGTITLHDRKHTVMDTKQTSTLSTRATKEQKACHLAHMGAGTRTLLPGQTVAAEARMPEGDTVVVEGWHTNSSSWPGAQLCKVQAGKVVVRNDTREPIMLGKKGDITTLKVSRTEVVNVDRREKAVDSNYYRFNSVEVDSKEEHIEEITMGKDIKSEVRRRLDAAHQEMATVFDESLQGGYNGYFGRHECRLNWAGEERPASNKLRVANYNHALNGLLQEVMDDMTRQGVLQDPQELGISVQSVCPVFLQRKKRAKDKPKELLTKKDVRMLVNFGPVNDKIKDVPTPMTTTDDIFNVMGRWKHIICFDLLHGFFQNHMSRDSFQWLGVMSPFGGLRVITRSAQGLLGMSEEFNQLIKRIIKEELQEGKCCQIIDDVFVGGETQEEAADTYIRILHKFKLANIKVSATKTFIFPQQVDILGWVWRQGGRLEPSPHRRNALVNTRQEDIKKVRDMRSWVGLYKTMRRATPNIANLLDALEQATADRDTKEEFVWTHELEQRFREAKEAVPKMHTLYLPAPEDRLMLVPDGSSKTPGIGHVLYAIKGEEKLPVRFHSLKLPDNVSRWSPCEVEALAFATGIEAEYDLIRESKHPLLICPDSKVVADAVALIRRGKYSASSRINRFITNVNKVNLEVAHISGKAKLNSGGDLQSRRPSTCSSDVCTVCSFASEAVDTVLDPAARCAAVRAGQEELSLTNRQAWLTAQRSCDACKSAYWCMQTGKTPSNKVGRLNAHIRQYTREAAIARDGLLVVRERPSVATGGLARERIVVPHHLIPTILYQLHNSTSNHPAKTQLRATFVRQFYAIELDRHLRNLYENCYPCSVLQRLPRATVQHESKAQVLHPHEYFHIDVIKRAKQNILLLVDHFSSFQAATLVQSEKAVDLKEGMVRLLEGVRRPGWITVRADNAKGFESIAKNDCEIEQLKIKLELVDQLNKNSNAVVDKGCQELEEELRKLSPEGQALTPVLLARAVLAVNQKLRRGGKLSAYEISSARDSNTGENLTIKDDEIRGEQLEKRKKENQLEQQVEEKVVKVGDTVVVRGAQEKHTARDMFIVTEEKEDKVLAQKLLHPLTGKPRLMSKQYETDKKRLVVIRSGDNE